MTNSGKGRKFLIFIKYMVIIGIIAGLAVFMWQERTRRIEAEAELNSTRQAKMRVERDLKSLQSEKQTLEGEISDQKARAQALATSLEEEKSAKQSLLAQVAKLQEELAIRKDEEGLLEEIERLKQEKIGLENILQQVRLAKQVLEERVVAAGAGGVVKLPKLVVSPGTSVNDARVLVVNRKHNFVVVGLGSDNGIKIGDLLTVHRKRRFIGKVRVEEVRDDVSAAAVLPEWEKGRIRKNDQVRLD